MPSRSTTLWSRAQARCERVLREPYLETGQVADLMAVGDDEVKSLAVEGLMLVYEDHGDSLFLALQFDPDTREPFQIVRAVHHWIGSGWGAANWWLKPHVELDGETPKQTLDSPQRHYSIHIAAVGTDIHDDSFLIPADY